MRSRWLLLCAAAFVVVESAALIYSLRPVLAHASKQELPELRLGVLPIPPLGLAQDEWNIFAKDFGKTYGCVLRIYFANSQEEAAAGLLNGSLDLLYCDAARYLSLNNQGKMKIWLYHRLSRREKERFRAALVSVNSISYLDETKGRRFTFSDREGMIGERVPARHLEGALPMKRDKWFASVSYAQSEKAALEMLLKGTTDIATCCDLSIEQDLAELNSSNTELKRLWISMSLPENTIISLASLQEDVAKPLNAASEKISATKLREEFLSARSMVFLPPDYTFMEALRSLQKFLDGQAQAPKKKASKPESR